MNKEVFVIEKMVGPGLWELVSAKAYLSEEAALKECGKIVVFMKKTDENFKARVKKLFVDFA